MGRRGCAYAQAYRGLIVAIVTQELLPTPLEEVPLAVSCAVATRCSSVAEVRAGYVSRPGDAGDLWVWRHKRGLWRK